MITRLVKMVFRAGEAQAFLDNFDLVKEQIRNFEGCTHLQLWNDISAPNTFFTYSKWESEDHLNAYRNSELFKETWAFTKALFADKPAAWSVQELRILD